MKRFVLLLSISVLMTLFSHGQTNWLTNWPEEKWKEYFKTNVSTLDAIEGLWNATITPTFKDLITGREIGGGENTSILYAIIKGTDGYDAIAVDNELPWVSAFKKTANPKRYFYQETIRDSRIKLNTNVELSASDLMEFEFYYPYEFKQALFPNSKPSYNKQISMHFSCLWTKAYPNLEDIETSKQSFGTGFAVSEDGLIATNFHVIENGNSILVKGINGDFNKPINATILVSDTKNDIAILRISNTSNVSIKNIPFTLKKESSSVGENVFVLGYPLIKTMGDEVKLTNGIISSKTGFQGDVTSYQISAPSQPGNSGGPLFNNKGELIGIVSAKHLGTENVTYAIKTSYLFT